MCFHMPSCAIQTHNVELPAETLAFADPFMVSQPTGSMFIRNEIEGTSARHFLPVVGSYHCQAGRVHVEEIAIRRDHFDTFGGCFDDCFQKRISITSIVERKCLRQPFEYIH